MNFLKPKKNGTKNKQKKNAKPPKQTVKLK